MHAVGGKLVVDATFAPPPLQDPFKWGTDIILHSGGFSTVFRPYIVTDILGHSSLQVPRWSFGFVGWRVGRQDR